MIASSSNSNVTSSLATRTIRLQVTRTLQDKNAFAYSFSNNEILINQVDTVLFVLDPLWNMAGLKPFIADHLCSNPNAVKHVAFGTIIDEPAQGGTPVEPSEIAYSAGQTDATYYFKLQNRELVNIGLLIGIPDEQNPSDPKKTKFILCDPQVGNGPPGGVFILAPFIT